jgi:hypothetical protein
VTDSPHAVWYAAYGSNLLYERFACYLAGGKAPGALRANPGARDPSPPTACEAAEIPGRLLFARHSRTWGAAVAFLDPQQKSHTSLARLYRITPRQMEDVLAQENHLSPGSVSLNPFALAAGASVVACEGWYGLVCRHPDRDGLPVITLTSSDDLHAHQGEPSAAYLRAMARGLKQTFPHRPDSQLAEYLLAACGPAATDRIDAVMEEAR